MKRLPDRYYDLVLERDQLLEESKDIIIKTPVDALTFKALKAQILSLDKEIKEIEKEIDEPKKMYIIAKEVIDFENPEDEYYFTKDYTTEEEAISAFNEQIKELLELFTDAIDVTNENGWFHIRDTQEAVTLTLYTVDID